MTRERDIMSDVIIGHTNGDEKPKNGVDQLTATNFLNCLDGILASSEHPIVLPGGDHHRKDRAPIVIVEPKIEINLDLGDNPTSALLEESIDRLKIPGLTINKSKSRSGRSSNNKSTGSSVSPNTAFFGDGKSHRHHKHRHTNEDHLNGNDSEHNKENRLTNGDAEKHHHHSHHHHHDHHNGNTVDVNSTTVAVKPDQVLRKYIIKKITIRKADGSTKKIVIKKPVDEPNAPLKLSKVYRV